MCVYVCVCVCVCVCFTNYINEFLRNVFDSDNDGNGIVNR